MTKTEAISCDCSTHTDGARGALVPEATAAAIAKLSGAKRAARIHGFVTLANHPAKMIRAANARKGIFPA
jgi:hypothetical protein